MIHCMKQATYHGWNSSRRMCMLSNVHCLRSYGGQSGGSFSVWPVGLLHMFIFLSMRQYYAICYMCTISFVFFVLVFIGIAVKVLSWLCISRMHNFELYRITCMYLGLFGHRLCLKARSYSSMIKFFCFFK